jgi:acid phosphatase type 7
VPRKVLATLLVAPVLVLALVTRQDESTGGVTGAHRCAPARTAVTSAEGARRSAEPQATTVLRLTRLPRPRQPAAEVSRLDAAQAPTFRLRVRILAAMREGAGSGGEIAVVVRGLSSRATMLVRIPDPACASVRRSPARASIVRARARFLDACGEPPPTHFARLTGTATISGAAVFGPAVGPRGAARNGVELSPLVTLTATRCAALPERAARIAAAGDIACDPYDVGFNGGAGTRIACRMAATSDLLVGAGLDAVLPLGDVQYGGARLTQFQRGYHLSWGRVKGISRPVVGNHEYETKGAAGYFDYFGGAAGPRGKGYYSYDVGAWHLIALNSNCAAVGGCKAGSRQERWLKGDLAANRNRCVLAYWHHPRFSSGLNGNGGRAATTAFWRALYAARADVVLNGHDHDYERFAPQTPEGRADSARGIRQFVVGTGGKRLLGWRVLARNSEVRQNTTFGVLELTLEADRYTWTFLPEAGATFADVGSETCR